MGGYFFGGGVKMTREQKRLSLQMRADGQTYAAIAAALGLPSSTIKSYCAKAAVPAPSFVPSADAPFLNASCESRYHAEEASDYCDFTDDRGASNDAPPMTDPARCRQCGEPLRLHSGNHMKRFCSESCRQKWWRAHKGELSAKASTSVCVGCGVTFKNGGNPNRRYCSRDCYFDHRFQRERTTGRAHDE
jgi:hypothetical protein